MTPESPMPRWPWSFQVTLIALLAIAAFFLVTEHAAHLYGVLPLLLLLACPLMHLFMHHGHGTHHRRDHPDDHRGESDA